MNEDWDEMYKFRQITKADKELILDFHCEINYASETSWAREAPYEQYKDKWFSTSQPSQFFSHLLETQKDTRTIAEIIEDDNGKAIGYIWVIFHDVPDYHLTIAEIMDIFVIPEYRRTGLGTKLLNYIEDRARRSGANLLRSETGIENTASIELHRKHGFQTYRLLFEKPLKG